MAKLAGGEFAGAWEALATARGRRRAMGGAGEWSQYSTAELVNDVDSDQLSDDQRTRMRAEIARRLARQRKR